MQLKQGVNVNDDLGLEAEADAMGAKALQMGGAGMAGQNGAHGEAAAPGGAQVAQMLPDWGNYLLGIGGAAAIGGALLGAAPAVIGVGGALMLGAAFKGNKDNGEIAAAKKKREGKRKLDFAFNSLHSLETRLLDRLRKMPPSQRNGRAKIEAELDALNGRRRLLIKSTIEGGHELWLPPSVVGEDRKSAKALWSSVSSNSGNIQVDQGDQAFRVNALSDVSKLLQSDHGRQMLGKLNAQQQGGGQRTIDIRPTLGGTDNAPKLAPNDGQVGGGSTVSMNYSEPSSNSMGLKDEPIYDPTYVKLGHELGHASHYLAGTAGSSGYTAKKGEDFVTEDLWTSQEEYNNITKEENPLRSDLGLAPRIYHKGYDDVLRTRVIFPAVEKLAARHKKLKFGKGDYEKHRAEIEDAEEWMHPTKRWAAFKTANLKTAVTQANQSMATLENVL